MGRKRFFLVDTLGLILKARVLPANTPEIKAAMGVLEGLNKVFTRLERVWADQRPCPPARVARKVLFYEQEGAFYGQDKGLRVGSSSIGSRVR
jgi:hypothetical protein